MDIAVNKTYAVFRTPFSETEDLVQSFSGIRGGGVNDQDPVDFFCAGLVRKACPDIWHADRLLALSTDEAPPQVIAGADMGGNHALECAVAAETAGAVLTVSDIGTLWRDEKNLGWTCLRLLPDGRGLFASENIGPSDTEYAFAEEITGSLRRADGALLRVTGQEPRIPMASCIRHRSRRITALKNGRWQRADGDVQGCDQAQIREVYEIVNPVSAIRALRDKRPPSGYTVEQSLALGDAMLRADILYTIHPDGAVVTDFDYQALQPIPWQGFLGLMYQEISPCHGTLPGPFPPPFRPRPIRGRSRLSRRTGRSSRSYSAVPAGASPLRRASCRWRTGGPKYGAGTLWTPCGWWLPAKPTLPSAARPPRRNARGRTCRPLPACGARRTAPIFLRTGLRPAM